MDLLCVHGVLGAGWDLRLPGDADGALFFSLQGEQGSGLMLERSSFVRAAASDDQLVIWARGGLRATVELVDER